MGSIQEFKMNGLSNSDDVGITVDLTEAQIDEIASQVGRFVGAVPFVIGDLYNQKCRVLGIDPNGGRPKNNSHAGVSVSDPLDALCDRMGVDRRTAENYASLARKWPRADRWAGLFMKHYHVVGGIDKPLAVALLKEAQIGTQKEDGSWDKPWSVRKLQEVMDERGIKDMPATARRLGTAREAAKPLTEESLKAFVPDLKAALEEGGVKGAKAKKIIKEASKAVEGVVVQLRSKYDDDIRAAVKEQLPQAEMSARELVDRLNKEREQMRQLSQGVSRPLTLDEFKLLRSFCHEDKHQSDPAMVKKAREASIIINRLGSKLGYIK